MVERMVLGRSDLRVSRLGFGCWQLGGHGWRNIDQQEILRAVQEALAQGINFFDTADVYGTGMSEMLLGQVLKNAKEAVVATKFGVRVTDKGTCFDNSRQWMRQALEESLQRLGRDTIDLYFMHRHDGQRPLADIFEDLESFRQAGKIRWYGISNFDPLAIGPIPDGLAAFTLEYNLLKREWETAALAAQQETRLGFVSWGSLAQGLLTGKYDGSEIFPEHDIRSREQSPFAQNTAHETALAALRDVAAGHKRSMAQTALRWVLDRHPQAVVLCGVKNCEQLRDNIGASGWTLSPAALDRLNQASVMEADA